MEPIKYLVSIFVLMFAGCQVTEPTASKLNATDSAMIAGDTVKLCVTGTPYANTSLFKWGVAWRLTLGGPKVDSTPKDPTVCKALQGIHKASDIAEVELYRSGIIARAWLLVGRDSTDVKELLLRNWH